jgi:hypothetical protein
LLGYFVCLRHARDGSAQAKEGKVLRNQKEALQLLGQKVLGLMVTVTAQHRKFRAKVADRKPRNLQSCAGAVIREPR